MNLYIVRIIKKMFNFNKNFSFRLILFFLHILYYFPVFPEKKYIFFKFLYALMNFNEFWIFKFNYFGLRIIYKIYFIFFHYNNK